VLLRHRRDFRELEQKPSTVGGVNDNMSDVTGPLDRGNATVVDVAITPVRDELLRHGHQS
jgi:hypothetical protein